MKKNRILKIGLLALALTLVTASLVSGTFAKYVTTLSGTGTVQVARWQARVGETETTVSNVTAFDLATTITDNADVIQSATGDKTVYIAPGTKGSFSLGYDTAGTEVDHNITIKITADAFGNLPTNMTLTPEAEAGFTLTGTINSADGVTYTTTNPIEAAGATGKTGTITVNWEWPEGTAVSGNQDTIDGETLYDNPVTFTAEFTAAQDNNDPI